ncbi:hypothetical protein CWE11_03200 [Aliidiomarina sanyensis]|uniref:Cellulose biosynthesis protein BcsE n=1 Tax=Aliidiomarina sanyensis TaxID=1249555 RepID=A0A432WPY6_9GAMM|nr:hypothetical protein CWE11_03200 [Aliidiomarina sanyensis]
MDDRFQKVERTLISLQSILPNSKPKLAPLVSSEAHCFVAQSIEWIWRLLDQVADQKPTCLLAQPDIIDRWQRRTEHEQAPQKVILGEWKHARKFHCGQVLLAIEKASVACDVIVLHLNFQAPGLIEKNLLTDDFFIQLQRWAARQNKLLLVMAQGEIDQDALHVFMQNIVRRFTSLHFIYQSQPDWRWSVQFWFQGYTLSRWNWDIREYTDAHGAVQLQIVTQDSEVTPTQRLGDKAKRLFCSNALEPGEFLPSDWKRIGAETDFRQHVEPGTDATLIIGMLNRDELIAIATRIFDLRKHAGMYLRILIRARDESLRLQDERFLISAGATLVLPSELSTRRVISLAETTLGFTYTHTLPETFDELKTNRLIDDVKGYLVPLDFVERVKRAQLKAERQGLDTLFIEADVATGLTPLSLIRRFRSRRPGDMITVSHGKLILFFYGCRETDAENVLYMSFGIPAANLFRREARFTRHGQILDACAQLEAEEKHHPSDDLSQAVSRRHDLAPRTPDLHTPAHGPVRKAKYI